MAFIIFTAILSGCNHTSVRIRKIILYIEEGQCEKVARFYHDTIGLPYKDFHNDYRWLVFDAGECELCIHFNNKGITSDVSRNNIVFFLDTQEKVLALHEMFLKAGYEEVDFTKPDIPKYLTRKQISDLLNLTIDKTKIIHSFWVTDPAGNIIQFEPW